MIDELKNAVNQEIEILKEIAMFSKRIESASDEEKALLSEGKKSLMERFREINDKIPNFLENIAVEKKGAKKKDDSPRVAKLERPEREAALGRLNINEKFIRRIQSPSERPEEDTASFKKSRGYIRLANRVFLDLSKNLVKRGYFSELPPEIRRANLDILFETYVAVILFSVVLSAALGLMISAALFFAGISFFKLFWIPIVLPIGVFFALYFYPSAEKRSISRRIDEEIPFAVIHMSSISGSGIEPTEIFRIIGLNKDYPFLKKEIRKVLNQINIYGYDLVSALGNVAKTTASNKLAELFNGLSTTINSGGNLSEFFQKRAELLMVSYRLEKEKFIKVAETFMDIYISVVIAAPMILMLLLVMISISGIETGFSPDQLTTLIIVGVAVINVGFLGFLQIKQT